MRAPRYLERFRCLGGDCPDDCCSVWDVAVDHATFVTLARLLDGRPERGRVRELPEVGRSEARWGEVERDEDGRCRMLEGDGRCALHGQLGEAALPVVCSMFPRRVLRAGAEVWAAATLACPETARLALLAEDALEWVDLDERERPELRRGARAVDASEDFTSRFARIDSLLADRRYPVAARIHAIADIRPNIDIDSDIDVSIRPAPGDAARGATQVAQVLAELLAQDAPRGFSEIVAHAIAGCDEDDDADIPLLLPSGAARISGASLARAHLRRVAALAPPIVETYERVIERYLRNHVRREPPAAPSDVLGHAQALALRYAALRVLLLAHPESISDPDRAIIDVCYRFARAVEHDRALVTDLARTSSDDSNDFDDLRALLAL